MRTATFGEIAEFTNDRAFKPEEWGTKGLPIIRIQNLTESSQITNYYDGEFEQKYLIKRGDLLISWSASLGVYIWSGGKALLNQHIFKVDLGKKVDKVYFYYAASHALSQMATFTHGSTMQHITKEPFEATSIPLPPLTEQKRIAAILEKADRQRRLRRYALELSGTYLQSVFLEMFGDPVTNPMGWDTNRLYQLCSKIVDCPHSTPIYTSTSTEYACVRSSDIQGGVLDWSTTKYVSSQEYQKRIYTYIPEPNEIVYCREGARFGNAAIIPKGKKICLGQRMMLFRAAPNIATPEFIWAFLESGSAHRQANRIAGGSASPHLNVGDIKKFITTIPPLSLQQKFTEVVRRFERLRAQQVEAERQAEHLFQTLLHKAFQGKLTDEDTVELQEEAEPEESEDNGQATPDVMEVEPVDTDAYQMALPME